MVSARDEDAISKGEFILITDAFYKSETTNLEIVNTLPTEKKLSEDHIRQIEESGGKIHYLKTSYGWKLISPEVMNVGHFELTIEECIVKGNAIAVVVILGILALIGNIMEMKARGGKIIAVIEETDDELKLLADDYFEVPSGIPEILSSISYVIPLQLFAYYMAIEKGLNPVKPRNLAKSVTVL